MKKQLCAFFLALAMVLSLLAPAGTAKAASTVTISQSSATIQAGESIQLSALVDNVQADASWGSSDTSVASVDQTGLVTGIAPGSSVITAMAGGTTAECLISVVNPSSGGTTRYNVLILDTSGSVKGTPLKREKAAAKRFCKKVLGSAGDNYVALVTLNSSSSVVCSFTSDYSALSSAISKLKAGGKTNMNQALKKAGTLLGKVSGGSEVMKNVILCSDGLPQTGSKSTSGRYKASDHKDYKYANPTYRTDVKLKNKGYFIYALGFFHNSSGDDLAFGKKLMKDLASKNKYYVVTSAKKIDDVFDDIADQITSTTISKKSLTLYVGESATLSVLVDGVATAASWKSSKTSIATVSSSGKVKGVKKGKCKITGTVDGKSVTCTVTVKNKKTTSSKPSISLNKSSATIYAGNTLQLKATVKGSSSTVKWSTSDKSIATVTKSGKVKGISEGTVTITAKANGVTATCTVNVIVKHQDYSVYISIPASKCYYGKVIDEVGLVVTVNEGAVITKCGAYWSEKNGSPYVAVGVTGTNITSAKLVAYFSRSGTVLYTNGYSKGTTHLNIISMRADSDGIWSYGGNFSSIRLNYHDENRNDISAKGTGTGRNVQNFNSEEELVAWLKG